MALVNCKECAKEISSEAKACPNCGKSQTYGMRPVFKVLGAIIVILLALSIFAGRNAHNNQTAAIGADSSIPPSIRSTVDINAAVLAQEYTENEVATDEKYKNVSLHVSGLVQSINKDFANTIVIDLATSNEFMPARMSLLDDQKDAAIYLHKGSMVTVECEKIMRSIGSPIGRNCRFVKKHDTEPADISTLSAINRQKSSQSTNKKVSWNSPAEFIGTFNTSTFDNCCVNGEESKEKYFLIHLINKVDIVDTSTVKPGENLDEMKDVDSIQLGISQSQLPADIVVGKLYSISCKSLWEGDTGHYALPVYCNEPKIIQVTENTAVAPAIANE